MWVNDRRQRARELPIGCGKIKSEYIRPTKSPLVFPSPADAPGQLNSHKLTVQLNSRLSSIVRASSVVKAPTVLSGYKVCELLLSNVT
jgi:hypothetical protein